MVSPDATRSLAVFPGGSLGEYNLPADLTVVLARGVGPHVWETAGRRFVDFDELLDAARATLAEDVAAMPAPAAR